MKILKIKLHWQILIALALAVLFGYYVPSGIKYTAWMGDIFLTALKMVIVPLILSSIISGVTSMGGGKSLGRLGGKTMLYYLSTSTLAILTGLLLVNIIRPGVGIEMGLTQSVEGLTDNVGSINEILMRIVPPNIFSAMANGEILPIIFFAIIFGVFITQVNDKYKSSLTTFFEAVFEVMMKMTMFIIKFTPLGIFGIVSREVSRNAHQLADLAGGMAIYMLTVVLSLGIHAFVTLPLILRFVAKAKPFKHFNNMATALLTAFSTASSSATLPLTMEAVEHKSGVSNKITSFTLPLGATVNMDGTALYECVAAMFIAQVYGIEFTFIQQILIVVTALLASIGAAGIPMAGLVMLTVILTAAGLPLEGIGLILAVDLPLDMARTSINVWSDSCGAVTVARSEKEPTNIAI
ncbi:dicarboxylate/amino acid:cation symporter [Draconibacterium sp. IB214405]|uniref:dicarboxylate/amino acid:cation symporter n=1 Tax=Draconibacterium sp. IB214405 TaxID=3097352 RepID=UPI002A1112E3|nr:dicarboxylate/amino acid:cation symporter [Draconibacterium sp. IB214405]MDX8340402.1 dicarboxylate/amino acid:cation symporter [Draconibacterium sp. IB214405]